ncbi:hypothetical protein EYB25_006089 [Talaromyces marneffei]|nr:hypothetical protein EYB25_006089 [Talaromyces marneffei]
MEEGMVTYPRGVEKVEKQTHALQQKISVEEGHGTSEELGDFHRSFTPRQVHVISLGSSVGSGLFIATGKALADAGPASMLIAYCMVCIGIWGNLQTLTEMTIAFPTSGNYIDYAGRWVDPALAFGAGFAEWLGWTAVVASEATFCVVLINYWAKDSVPEAALLTIFLIGCLSVFLLPNRFFAWLEYFGSLVKAFLFIFIIIISVAIIAGAGPTGKVVDGSNWTNLPAFKHGFGGFSNAALLAIWAVGDQVFIGVMGGEAKSPRFSMAHAANLIPWRTAVFYLVCIIFVATLVPSDDPNLLGGSGVTSSPFVIAVQNAGIKGVPDFMNACMLVGILAIALESIYLPSRVLRTMAVQKLLPGFIARVDSKGRPRWALAITALFATAFTYMSLSANGFEVLTWLISITSASFFINWAIIGFTSFRFHAAFRAQKMQIFKEQYGWRSTLWPLAPIVVLTVSAVLLICLLYASCAPLRGGGFTAYNFFSYTIGLLVIVIFTLAYKIILRTKWQDPMTADLVTGRRELTTEEIQQLDAYYSRPMWRRLCEYMRLW